MDKQKKSTKTRVLNHLGKVGVAIISVATMLPGMAQASEPTEVAKDVLATEGGKQALNHALKIARGKPALTLASVIVCGACIPVAHVAF